MRCTCRWHKGLILGRAGVRLTVCSQCDSSVRSEITEYLTDQVEYRASIMLGDPGYIRMVAEQLLREDDK